MSIPLRVLIVEDSEDDAQLLLRELRRSGYDPTWERVDTQAAMQRALNQPVWDLVIADHALPSFSGPAALAALQENGLDLPFILVSGTIGEETAVAAMKAGAHDYLMKGNLVRLGAAIEREMREAETRRERQRAEAALAQTNAQLQETLQLKDEMIANVSHELRTPLTHISGYSELLCAGMLGGNLSPDELHAIEVIYKQSQRLIRLVDTLLTLQTLDAPSLAWEPVNLKPLVEHGVIRWQEPARQGQIALRLETSPEDVWIRGDYQALGQAFDQLLDNALKFTAPGDTISVRLEQREREVWLTIADSGVGIPPDKLQQVFEPFYQVDGSSTRRYGGMGLGLALARHIVSLHHGRVWAESEGGGKGATFRMALPMAPAPEMERHFTASTFISSL